MGRPAAAPWAAALLLPFARVPAPPCTPPLGVHVEAAAGIAFLRQAETLAAEAEAQGGSAGQRRNFGSAYEQEGGHRVLFLQQLAAAQESGFLEELWNLSAKADEWGIAGAWTPQLRCLELIAYEAAEGHSLGFHEDGSTLLTVVVMLSEPARDFDGGGIELYRKDAGANCTEEHHPHRGDIVAWRGWDYHRVAPVTKGTRRILVAEWWLGPLSDFPGRPEDTEVFLRQALEIDPTSANLHAKLGSILVDSEDFEAAEESYAEAARLNPERGDAHSGVGLMQVARRDFEGAERSFQAALQVDPGFGHAHLGLGKVQVSRGELTAAEESYVAALRWNPTYADAHYSLGALKRKQGDLEAAEQSLMAALRANPVHVHAHVQLGTLHVKRKDLKGAEELFLAAVRLAPALLEAQSSLGMVSVALGNLDLAQKAFAATVRLKPSSASVHTNLGALQVKQGDFKAAEESFLRALSLKPADATARTNLEETRRRVKEGAAAHSKPEL